MTTNDIVWVLIEIRGLYSNNAFATLLRNYNALHLILYSKH